MCLDLSHIEKGRSEAEEERNREKTVERKRVGGGKGLERETKKTNAVSAPQGRRQAPR